VKTLAAFALLCAAMTLQAQSNPQVVVTGNSIAQYEYSLQGYIFPSLPAAAVYIGGFPGYSCETLEPSIVPAVFNNGTRDPRVVVLIDTTNDWALGTSANDLMTCLEGTIQNLLTHKSTLQIVVLTTPPYTAIRLPGCPNYGDQRTLIESYNSMMPELQTVYFPGHVTVVDAFTPFEAGDTGWANPSLMTGPCGIHPGPAYTWSGGQPTLAAIYNQTVLNLLSTPSHPQE
jgi:hypothetical protein